MLQILPYVLYSCVYFFSALMIYHSKSEYTIFGIILVTISILWSIYFIFNRYQKNISSIVFSFHAIKNHSFIDAFTIPSSITYRVRKNYDISSSEIKQAELDIKNIFKNKLDALLYDKKEPNINISNISYIFWYEFFKSEKIYQDFCLSTVGEFVCPPLEEINQIIASSYLLKPSLKSA